MELDVEREDDRLVIGSDGEDHTIMTLLKQAAWDEDAQAGYDRGHPYTGNSKLVIHGDDADSILEQAIERVKDDLAEFADTFESA